LERTGVYFYLQALSAKGWSPKGKRGKENTLPVKQQVGFQPGAFWSTVECFNHVATVSLQMTGFPLVRNTMM